jgi:galactose mutarotase-like enzyme
VEGTESDFRQPKRIGSIELDHAFTDLERNADGLARVELRDSDRETKLSLWADQSYPYLMLFYTLLGIMPTNRILMATEPARAGPDSRALIEKWAALHAGRTALGFAATLIFLWASMS